MAYALTVGEPAGIGPDIIIALAQTGLSSDITVFGCAAQLQARAKLLELPLHVHTDHHDGAPGHITVHDIPFDIPTTPGQADTRNVAVLIKQLTTAAERTLHGEYSALITAPVQKSIIADAGVPFTGHTEFLAKLSNVAHPVMMLANDKLRVALATTHVPLNAVANNITQQSLRETIFIVHNALQNQFGLACPKIAVLGLNPHAGEGGHLGMEEINIISPVIENLQAHGMDLIGPLPSDTAFAMYQNRVDAFVAMYHDQGLPVVKTLDFDGTVNITLGLPFVRTSVDHGTALDLAGTGKARALNLNAAIHQARNLSKQALR